MEMTITGTLGEMETKMAGKMETETVDEMETETKKEMGMEILIGMTEVFCLSPDRVEKFIGGLPDNIQRNVIAAEPTRLQDVVRIANNLIDQKLKGYAVKNVENKRIFDNHQKDNRIQQPPYKRQNACGQSVARAYTAGNNVKRGYVGPLAYCNKCAHKSFVSSTFSSLLDITPSTLDVSYAVELADRRISKTITVLRGYTLGLLGHPFNKDLMPLELGSFDVIIGIDWLANHHALIICDKKIVRIFYRDEVLIVQGERSSKENKLKLRIVHQNT
uniref:Reverse transcriptase domain-containing protein n=1 Tax=Tanacetum cinerariifolium TaxID=118510 RepID=A0A699I9H0_TANCI|nr:reverse transcriptase domain-containing protein [Tanacetum cinerariifolium]